MGSIWLDGRSSAYPSVVDVLRGAGLVVQTWDGWQHRSRSSGGFEQLLGIVVHHTASPAGTSFQNDWSYAVNGKDNPIANLMLGRGGEIGVHAAGASNHAGKGGPWTTSGGVVPVDDANRRMFGIEASNNGTGENWPAVQVDTYERIVAALCTAYRLDPRRDVVAHFEWAPGRKIDPWGGAQPTPGFPYTGPRQWVMRGGAGFTDAVAARGSGDQEDEDTMLQLITPTTNKQPIGKTFARWQSGVLTWATNADTLLASRLGIVADNVEMGGDQYQNLCDQAGVSR